MQDIQILKIIDMKLGGRRWQCVTGLQKCMAYNLPGKYQYIILCREQESPNDSF